MEPIHHRIRNSLKMFGRVAGCIALLTSCQSLHRSKDDKPAAAANASAEKGSGAGRFVKMATSEASQPDIGLSFLLSMTFDEAKTLSKNNMVLPSGARVAADEIEVVKQTKDGQPKKVRAKGKVFLEMGKGDPVKVLCHEAYFTSDEAVLRGKPILQRGGSIIEGMDHGTVFYMLGTRLRVIGTHKVTNQSEMIASLPDLGPWTGGPNPLLPPLTENAVPRNVRAEMQRAAEAEAVLQRAKAEAEGTGPPAPWIKDEAEKPGKETSA